MSGIPTVKSKVGRAHLHYIASFQIAFGFQTSKPYDKLSAQNIAHLLAGRMNGRTDQTWNLQKHREHTQNQLKRVFM